MSQYLRKQVPVSIQVNIDPPTRILNCDQHFPRYPYYGGKIYSTCTFVDSPNGQAWCRTAERKREYCQYTCQSEASSPYNRKSYRHNCSYTNKCKKGEGPCKDLSECDGNCRAPSVIPGFFTCPPGIDKCCD